MPSANSRRITSDRYRAGSTSGGADNDASSFTRSRSSGGTRQVSITMGSSAEDTGGHADRVPPPVALGRALPVTSVRISTSAGSASGSSSGGVGR